MSKMADFTGKSSKWKSVFYFFVKVNWLNWKKSEMNEQALVRFFFVWIQWLPLQASAVRGQAFVLFWSEYSGCLDRHAQCMDKRSFFLCLNSMVALTGKHCTWISVCSLLVRVQWLSQQASEVHGQMSILPLSE